MHPKNYLSTPQTYFLLLEVSSGSLNSIGMYTEVVLYLFSLGPASNFLYYFPNFKLSSLWTLDVTYKKNLNV